MTNDMNRIKYGPVLIKNYLQRTNRKCPMIWVRYSKDPV